MYNGFIHKRLTSKTSTEAQQRSKVSRIARAASTNAELYKTQSLARTNQWIRQSAGTKTATVLSQGTTLLMHPDNHQFRDYSPLGSVYVRKYVPEKTRVLLTSTKYFHEHYVQEPFNASSPHIVKGKWLRPRNKTAEIRDRMVYNHINENERVAKAVAEVKCTTEPIDPKHLVDPAWRPVNKQKFLTRKGFDLRLRTSFGGKHDNQVWPTVGEHALRTEYKGGYEETGKLDRERDKSREIGRCFSSSSPRDTWQYRLNESTSIRKYMSDKAMEEIEKEIMLKNKQLTSMIELDPSPQKAIERSLVSGGGMYEYDRIEEKKEEHENEESNRKRATTTTNHPNSQKIRLRSIKTGFARSHETNTRPIPRSDLKIYKKSLENHYFATNSSPMKEAKNRKEAEYWTQFNLSSTQILRQQLSHDHWTSDFNGSMGDVERKLKQVRNIKTPAENFRHPDEFYKFASPIRAGTRSSIKKYRHSEY